VKNDEREIRRRKTTEADFGKEMELREKTSSPTFAHYENNDRRIECDRMTRSGQIGLRIAFLEGDTIDQLSKFIFDPEGADEIRLSDFLTCLVVIFVSW